MVYRHHAFRWIPGNDGTDPPPSPTASGEGISYPGVELRAAEPFSAMGRTFEEEAETVRKNLILPIRNVSEAGHHIVVVCDMMDEDSGIDTPEMKRFDRWMQSAQQELAAEADGIAEVVAGFPNWIRKPTKGQERNQCSDH